MSSRLVAFVAACGCATYVFGQTFPTGFSGSSLAGMINRPTAMAVAASGDVYITQQGGTLRRFRSGVGLTDVASFTVDSTGERGLIGVALDPNFSSNRFVYIHYTATAPNTHNRVSRVTLDAAGGSVIAGSELVLVDLDPLSGATNHNGGAMHFGADGKLYIGVGDNASGSNAQSLSNRLGKVLRINPDGTIPSDNPSTFAGISGSTAGANRAIWAVGLRNPFTFNIHPVSGRIFINDVGEGTWEEINDGLPGRNYGWPATEGRFNAATFPNFTQPLVAYHHTNGALNQPSTIGNFTGSAITGGVFYSPRTGANANFPRSFENDYFFGDVTVGLVRVFDPAANTGEPFGSGLGAVVDLSLWTDNTLLILRGAGGGGGTLTRVQYNGVSGACCSPSGTCTTSNGIDCAPGSTFLWGTTSCTPGPCPGASGVCCSGSICALSSAAACTGPNTVFSAATTCNTGGNTAAPCCLADFNHTGGLSVQDIFDFLAAYFAGTSTADFNGAGISVQDIFDFLAAYFRGCP